MRRTTSVLLTFTLIFNSLPAFAGRAAPETSIGPQQAEEADCPVNLALNFEERQAFVGFNSRLSHLRSHFGKASFQVELNRIIAEQWPMTKVIEASPVFLEKLLNLVEQQHLKDSIAQTVGLKHPLWLAFDRTMKKVTLHSQRKADHAQTFTLKTQQLLEAIQKLEWRDRKQTQISFAELELYKARTVTRLANMVIYIERCSLINGEIIRQKGAASSRKLMLGTIGLTAAGVLVASVILSGPIVGGASTFAASFSTDAIVAGQLAKLGQIIAGAGLGAAGTPTTLLLTDATSSLWEGRRRSLNNDTVMACELDKQMAAWRKRGVSPYLSAALAGGMIGVGGGALTLHKAGARVVLLGTTFGVGVAQLYSAYKLSDNTMRSLAEYRLAIEQQALGNNSQARLHVQNSRHYANLAKESGLETILIAVLSVAIGQSFKTALVEGEKAIRVIFANSTDTLPLAIDISKEVLNAITNRP